jgi:hypothetical protein
MAARRGDGTTLGKRSARALLFPSVVLMHELLPPLTFLLQSTRPVGDAQRLLPSIAQEQADMPR